MMTPDPTPLAVAENAIEGMFRSAVAIQEAIRIMRSARDEGVEVDVGRSRLDVGRGLLTEALRDFDVARSTIAASPVGRR